MLHALLIFILLPVIPYLYLYLFCGRMKNREEKGK
jgi:hypothetical protein